MLAGSASAGGAPAAPTTAPGELNVSLTDGAGTADATWAVNTETQTVNLTDGTVTDEAVADLPTFPGGTSDAINFAVSNATATNDTVVVGDGQFNGTANVDNGNVALVDNADNTTTVDASGETNGIVIDVGGVELRGFDEVTADANGTVVTGDNVDVTDVNISDTDNNGLLAPGVSELTVSGGVFENIEGASGRAVELDLGSDNVTIENIESLGNQQFIEIQDSQDVVVRDSYSFDSGRIRVAEFDGFPTGNITIHNNTIEQAETGGTFAALTLSEGPVNVTGNQIDGTSDLAPGIEFGNEMPIVRDNIINGTGEEGIIVTGDSSELVNNTITNSSNDALVLDGADNANLTDNSIIGTDANGTLIDGATGTTLTNTTVRDTADSAFQAVNGANATTENFNIGDSTAENTTLDFEAQDVALDNVTDPEDNPDAENISRYFNATSTSASGFLNVSLQYENDDVTEVEEDFLRLWNYTGTQWNEIEDSTVDTGEQVVQHNITEFSTFGIFESTGANSVEVQTQPADTTAGEVIAGPPAALVTDGNGDPVEGVDVDVSEEGGYIFDAGDTTVQTDASGVATFNNLEIETADENYQLNFSIDSADEDVAEDDFALSNEFNVTASDITAFDVTETAGQAGEIDVNAQDAAGNDVEGETIEVEDDGGLDGVNIGDTVDTGTDGNATFGFNENEAGTYPLEFSAEDGGVTDTATVTVEAADPDSIVATTVQDTATADGADEVEYDVSVEDEFGNAVEGVEVNTTDDGTDIVYDGDDIQDTDANGEVTVTATSTTAQDVTFTFEEQENSLDDTATGTFEAGEPADVTATTVTGTATADGTDEVEYEVTVEDAEGNAVEGVEVVTTDDGTDIVYDGDDSQNTDANGEVTVTATSTTAQDVTFTFVEQQNNNQDTATGTFGADDANSVEVETEPDATQTAGEAITGPPEANVTDSNGNPVENVVVDVEEVGGYTFDAGTTTVQTNASGVATFDDLVIETADVVYELEFSIDGADANVEASDTAYTATFEVEPNDPDNLTAQDATAVAGESEDLTVTVEDAFDNRVAGETVEVQDNNGLNFVETTNDTNSAGVTTLEFNENTADTYTPTIENGTGAIQDTATVTVEAGDADSVEVETEPEDTTAGEVITGFPSANVTDSNGNPVENVDVEVEAIGSGGITAGQTTVPTDASGIATFDDLVIETADNYELVFSIVDADANVEASDTAQTATFTVEPTEPANVIATADIDTATPNSNDEIQFTVTVEDDFGNAVEDGTTVETTDDGTDIDYDGDDSQTTTDGQVVVTATSTTSQDGVTFTFEEQTNNNFDTATAGFGSDLTDRRNVGRGEADRQRESSRDLSRGELGERDDLRTDSGRNTGSDRRDRGR